MPSLYDIIKIYTDYAGISYSTDNPCLIYFVDQDSGEVLRTEYYPMPSTVPYRDSRSESTPMPEHEPFIELPIITSDTLPAHDQKSALPAVPVPDDLEVPDNVELIDGEYYVLITVPADFLPDDLQSFISAQVDNGNFYFAEQNDAGNVNLKIEKTAYEFMIDEITKHIDSNLDAAVKRKDYQCIFKVEHNSDFSHYTLHVFPSYYDEDPLTDLLDELYHCSQFFHILIVQQLSGCKVKIVDTVSQDHLNTVNLLPKYSA